MQGQDRGDPAHRRAPLQCQPRRSHFLSAHLQRGAPAPDRDVPCQGFDFALAPEIGRRFGGRDHTTVLQAVRKIESLVGNDRALAEEIEMIKRELQE